MSSDRTLGFVLYAYVLLVRKEAGGGEGNLDFW
jgi:hypothetical protein